jgi:transcriptional regulator GlxA family with amidase domain
MPPAPAAARHRVAVLALADAVPLNLAIPFEALTRAAQLGMGYEVVLCGDGPVVGAFGRWHPAHPLTAAATADTLLVPGRYVDDAPVAPAVLDVLRAAAARGARIASLCGGAFVLAEAGLLDGRPATTHWHRARHLQRRYPGTRVDPRPLYVDDGRVLTGAGLAAGLDLCVHLVRADHGAAAAARLARVLVVAPHREGGQAQFVESPVARPDGALGPLRAWVCEHLDRPLTLADLARRAACSERTLLRRFRAETGTSPLRWITDRRIDAALVRLETTDETLDDIAHRTGLGSAAHLRRRVRARTGLAPADHRRAHRGRSSAASGSAGP